MCSSKTSACTGHRVESENAIQNAWTCHAFGAEYSRISKSTGFLCFSSVLLRGALGLPCPLTAATCSY